MAGRVRRPAGEAARAALRPVRACRPSAAWRPYHVHPAGSGEAAGGVNGFNGANGAHGPNGRAPGAEAEGATLRNGATVDDTEPQGDGSESDSQRDERDGSYASFAWESLQHDEQVTQAVEMLGLDSPEQLESFTDAGLKRQYWRMARRLHPDTKTGSRYRFVALQTALDILQQETKMRRHREEEARKRQERERLNEELRRATAKADAEAFRRLCDQIKEKRLDMDATTLFRMLDGANVLYQLEDPAHMTYCSLLIESWEDATGRRAARDVYHSIMWQYCTKCEDSCSIHRALSMLMNGMARTGIELTDQSIQMVRQMVRRAGRMGSLGGEGSALRM